MWEGLRAWLTGGDDTAVYYFAFNAPVAPVIAVVLLLVAAVGISFWYWPRLKGLRTPTRATLVVLRTVAVVLVLFLVFDPCIVKHHVRPGEHYVAVLFDDSKSMEIAVDEGLSRGEGLKQQYESSRADFIDEMRRKYQVALYRFGELTERIRDIDDIEFAQSESKITEAVNDVVRDLQGAEVSAVVVLSDGAEQPRAFAESELEDIGVPVFTVGVGRAQDWRDLKLARVTVKRTDFDKSPVTVNMGIRASGLAGEQAVAEIIEQNRVVESKLISIGGEDEEQLVTLEYVPSKQQWLEYEARVRLAQTGAWNRPDAVPEIVVPAKDPIYQNNSKRFIVDNREKVRRILYLSGRPNWENKFFRRAMADDDQLKVTSLIRISGAERRKIEFRGNQQSSSSLSNPLFEGFEGQSIKPRYDEAVFLRIGIEEESDLVTGYPEHAENLFPYHMVIWSAIEHNFFSRGQLELTREFVQKRGGSLLFLGGDSSFAEGNYAGTIIEGMIPVVLRRSAGKEKDHVDEVFRVDPTVEGMLAGSWQLSPNSEENRRIWAEMPSLQGVNVFPMTRAGASVLARVRSEDPEIDNRPMFIVQRYGEGKSAVMATSETWQWQMQQDIDDQTHERFWRQLVRSLVKDVPEATYLRDKADAYIAGNTATLEFVVRDEKFDEREELNTTVEISPPSGLPESAPVEESIREAGLYMSEFTPEQPGMHRVVLTAQNEKGETVGAAEEAILVTPDEREFQQARYNRPHLETMAKATGGRFFELSELADVAGTLPWTPSQSHETIRYHLWHWPPFFFTIVVLFTLEWFLRRRAGRA